ncbi:MAG: hypothetical protein AB9834_01335 [Lentimicrobium sp.]
MEYLYGIYDGSEHINASGYHLCRVTTANLTHEGIVPLHCEAYSGEARDSQGSTEKLKDVISRVSAFTKKRGRWAIDRQVDDIDLINYIQKEEIQFVTRLMMIRYLHFDNNINRQVKAERIHHHVKMNYKAQHLYNKKWERRFSVSEIWLGYSSIAG